jgi:hypothetical protein
MDLVIVYLQLVGACVLLVLLAYTIVELISGGFDD